MVASLVPVKGTVGATRVAVESQYPFTDSATVRVDAEEATQARGAIQSLGMIRRIHAFLEDL